MTDSKIEKINHLISRNTEKVITKKGLKEKLESGEKLRVKLGIDPTSTDIHIGNAVVLWKLKEFQDLGHQVVFLIGDFTAQIGDPSDKQSIRQPLSQDEIKENMADYVRQVALILDINKVEVVYNSKWLAKLGFDDILELAGIFTVQQMTERENFAKRIDAGKPVGLHEILYPLMQGYDSVAIKADVEVGGSDQLFNMLAGRQIQKAKSFLAQDVLTTKLLIGLDGRKMSMSYDNFIAITQKPTGMFGKAMSISDDLIPDYLELATDLPKTEIAKLTKLAKTKPRDAKAQMAHALVARYHGNDAAASAEREFNKVFKEGQLPKNIPTQALQQPEWLPADLLVELKLAPSKGAARRLIESGGAKLNQKPITDWKSSITLKQDDIISAGKLRHVKIKLNAF